MSNINYGRGYVYSLKYHLVWCTKYRKNILNGRVESKVKELIEKIAQDHDIIILEMEIDGDHIHMLIDCKPQHYLPSIIKAFKGTSARFLFLEYPELREELWGGHLWNPSYFVSTISEHTESQIKAYIQKQKIKEF
jgi:putative transposase